VDFTIVDDYHMFRAGLGEDEVYGPCRTQGITGGVTLFPSLTRLRYYMPFKPPQVTVDLLKRVADKRKGATTCFFFADDGEKFGAWPYTYWWVHKKGWLKRFFKMLEDNSSWLSTATYSEVLETVPAKEVGEVPRSSYAEMMEWSGGDFRNFFKKYPESGRMQRRMLSVSGILGSAEVSENPPALLGEAKKELYKAQTGCAYWHGTFGGVYLPHLRSGVYSHLISAENLAEGRPAQKESAVSAIERGTGDGNREMLMRNSFLGVFVDPSSGGALVELDHKPSCVNLTNVVSRVREDYHDKLDRKNSSRMKEARKAILRGDFADVHDVLGVRERGLLRMIEYDDYRRLSFLTHIFKEERAWGQDAKWHTGHERFLKGEYAAKTREDGGDMIFDLWRRDKAYASSARSFDLEVVKSVRVGTAPRVKLSQSIIRHSGSQPLPQYAVEFNFSLWDDTVKAGREKAGIDHFSLQDRYTGLKMDITLDRAYDVVMYPLYTVNETESGLVKTFQGVSVAVCDGRRYDGVLETPKMEIEIAMDKIC
jgi:alpha-amylase